MQDFIQEMVLPTQKETLVDQIHNKILEIIIQGGATEKSVFTEGKLVQQFEVSKATVREALVRLCNENILHSIPRYGYVIARMGNKDLRDIKQFRSLLEVTALRDSAKRIGRPEMERMREMLDRHSSGNDNTVWDIWKKNIEFHSLLISFSNNSIYVESLQRVMQRQMLYFGQTRWKENRNFSDFLHTETHEHIYTELLQKSFDQAIECLKKDIDMPTVPDLPEESGWNNQIAHL